MKIISTNGHLKIDDKEVLTVIFTDGSSLKFPIQDSNDISLNTERSSNSASIRGNGNVVVQGKNIVTGNVTCKGDFRLGDG